MDEEPETEFYMTNTNGADSSTVKAGIRWLLANKGGSIIAPRRQTIADAFQANSDREFKEVEHALAEVGISLAWEQRGMYSGAANILMMYMDRKLDREIWEKGAKRVLFLPWTEDGAAWCAAAYRPTVVAVNDAGSLVPIGLQPNRDSLKNRVPQEQDEILELMASMAAGYGNHLQRIEIERFKAELNNYRMEWMRLDPKIIWLRCAELGMSLEDADKVSRMVRDLQRGHVYRPKPAYKDGWRH